MNKSTPTLTRRDFLHLGSLFIGGLVVSPFLKNLNDQIIGLEGGSTKAGVPGTQSSSSLPTNPLLKKLGFNETDKVAIIELDDLGLCEANLAAFYEMVDSGMVVSGRAIVPSAWFPQVAHFARTHPGLDIGVTLTLMSELTPMRWRPLSTVDQASGLMDQQGYFPINGISSTISNFQPVAQELLAQVIRAQGMGIRVTHLSIRQQHLLISAFLPSYLEAAQSVRLPLAFLRPDEIQWSAIPGISAEWVKAGMGASTQLDQQGAPLLDSIVDLSATAPDERLALTKQALDNLGAGVHLITLRAAKDTPELRALTPDWKSYVADYQTWTSQELATHLRASGIQVIHWKALQAIL